MEEVDHTELARDLSMIMLSSGPMTIYLPYSSLHHESTYHQVAKNFDFIEGELVPERRAITNGK